MKRFVHFILISLFLFAGVSQVPLCYATKPNCDYKSTQGCPLLKAPARPQPEQVAHCCMHEQSSRKQQPENSLPPDRLKRLTIDQIQNDLTPLLSSTTVLSNILRFEHPGPGTVNKFAGQRYINPHYHPPPLFIQYQTFLI